MKFQKTSIVFLLTTIFVFSSLLVFSTFEIKASCFDQNTDSDFNSCYQNNTGTTKSFQEKTALRLFQMKHSFNEGSPIVFHGKLVSNSGEPIPKANITIFHDGDCINKTIANGTTDKMGMFWILTTAKIWDTKDNLIKATAVFDGNNEFLPAFSESRIVVVYPIKNNGCL